MRRCSFNKNFLEKDYEKALIYELESVGYNVTSQQTIKVVYKGIVLDCELRYDILVENLVVVENKSVLNVHPVHESTLRS